MKLLNISEIQPTLPFTAFDIIKNYHQSFEKSELGRICRLLPLKERAAKISAHFPKKPQGRKRMFSPEGEVALMSLRAYYRMSDNELVEMLNGNIHAQMFCDVGIDPSNPLSPTLTFDNLF